MATKPSRAFVCCPEQAVEQHGSNAPWSPENLYLTASNKLNRKPIEMGFETQLKAVKQMGIR